MCCGGLIEKLPQLDTCCCCCKVEFGSKVIAWIAVITALLDSIGMGVGVASLLKSSATAGVIAASIFVVIVMVCVCILAVLLLLGLYQEDMNKVRFWLQVSVCLFCTMVVAMISSIIAAAVGKAGASAVVNAIVQTIVYVLFQLYMLSVVKSHYHNMTDSFDGRA